jgi:phosphohistidine swiveling domain-containing protein
LVQSPVRDFPVEWRSPEDAEMTWAWDGMHCPRPLTPLSTAFTEAITRAEFDMSGRESAEYVPPIFPNGFMYGRFRLPDPDSPVDDATRERQARTTEEAKQLHHLWRRRWLPQLRRLAGYIRDTDCAGMSTADLIEHLATCIEKGARAFAITLYAANPMFVGVQQFYTFCQEELGPEGIALAGAAIQGYQNESAASDTALFHLAQLARRLGLQTTLLESALLDLDALLARMPAGREFWAAFTAAMDRYGWRVPSWFELSQPAWREDPSTPLSLVRDYLDQSRNDPRQALARAAGGRRRALRTLRRRLTDVEKRAQFEALWQTARQFVPVSEGRALWQLSLSGFLRLPALALGHRLVDEAVLDSSDGVFHLRLEELQAGPDTSWRQMVQARAADRERWLKVVPPLTIGSPPRLAAPSAGPTSGPPALPFGLRMVSGFGGERSTDERILKGHAASPGLATGPARVIETIDQADKVEPGDILVCRFTTPSWSHLFSRVAAIVADSGGVLSHCAILAREYAIPCVPGVRVGTRRLRDGMMLTVDGTQGIVRIEE